MEGRSSLSDLLSRRRLFEVQFNLVDAGAEVLLQDVRQRDVFGKSRIADGIYTSGQIDVSTWHDDIEADYQAWVSAMS